VGCSGKCLQWRVRFVGSALFAGSTPLCSLANARSLQLTHNIARNTSVTRNRVSTSHGRFVRIHPPGPSGPGQPEPWIPPPCSADSNSPRKSNAHRSPHHPAGAMLKARQTSSGTCHLELTPSKTATRGRNTDVRRWAAFLSELFAKPLCVFPAPSTLAAAGAALSASARTPACW
jgi:hypothetical protein